MYGGKINGKFLGPTEDKPNRHMYFIEGERKTGVTTALGIKDKSAPLMSWLRDETVKHALENYGSGLTIEELVKCLYANEKSVAKAADLGSQIHAWCEAYINYRIGAKGHGKMPEMPQNPAVQQGAASFLAWEAEHKVKFLWSERVVYSRKHDYIGTADFAAKVDGELCLCDIKSGNGMYNSVRAQTAAYASAVTEETKEKFVGRWAIRVAKETEEEYEKRMDFKDTIRGYLGKEPASREPYQVFEAVYLDNEKGSMKEDFEAFLSHWNLYKWDAKTDFWKVKNGRV